MDRIEIETPLLMWTGDSGARAGMVRITGEPAEAIRVAALTGQWLDPRKSRKSAKVMAEIGATRWKNSVFPDEESGGWVMPVNQATRVAERLNEGDLVQLTIEI